jgi:hypothetical protein
MAPKKNGKADARKIIQERSVMIGQRIKSNGAAWMR